MKIPKPLTLAFAALISIATSLVAAEKTIGYFDAIEKEAAPVVGEQYYLRHCLKYEAGKEWPTTNYWTSSSILVPINSRVTLVSLSSNKMKFTIEKTGVTLVVKNIKEYSQKEMDAVAKNMLTRTPVPIERFEEKTAKNIQNGIVALGMTKEQVVMARGYPPGHKTQSLDLDSWIYWDSRFVTHSFVFENGILAKGRGL